MFVLLALLIIRLSSDGITKNQGPNFCQQSTNYIHATLHDFFLKQCVISYYIGYSKKAGSTAPPTVALQFFSCILHFYMFIKILFWYTDPEPNAGKNHRSPIFRYSKTSKMNFANNRLTNLRIFYTNFSSFMVGILQTLTSV